MSNDDRPHDWHSVALTPDEIDQLPVGALGPLDDAVRKVLEKEREEGPVQYVWVRITVSRTGPR